MDSINVVSFESLGHRYIEDLELRTTKKASVADAQCALRQFVRCVPELSVNMIDRASLRTFIKTRRAEGVMATTINGNLRFCKAALRFGRAEGVFRDLPVEIGKKTWLKEPKKEGSLPHF